VQFSLEKLSDVYKLYRAACRFVGEVEFKQEGNQAQNADDI
jgi:hypothetical protein